MQVYKPTRADHPIADLLRERNMPVHRLAAELGITERMIYYWINRQKKIAPMYLARLSEFFRVPPEHFQ